MNFRNLSRSSFSLRRRPEVADRRFRPSLEELENRVVPSSADGNGPVVQSLTTSPGSNTLAVTFDGPLSLATGALSAQNLAFFKVNQFVSGVDPRLIMTIGPAVPVVSGTYDGTSTVTLTLSAPLSTSVFYRIFINGTPQLLNNAIVPGSVLTGGGGAGNPSNGIAFDGDNDDTATGDFYAQFAVGTDLSFKDFSGDQVSVNVAGRGAVDVWRELDGDIDQFNIVGATGASTFTATSVKGSNSSGLVPVGSVTIPVSAPVNNPGGAVLVLPSNFIIQTTNPDTQAVPAPPPYPAVTTPLPVAATSQNLPFTESLTPINNANTAKLLGIQYGVYAQTSPDATHPLGLWVIFAGRTNGLHDFTPSGVVNFPPSAQNGDIMVVDPSTWQSWVMPWSSTDVSATVYKPLTATAPESYQKGDTLYVVGGYISPDGVNFTTYDTLTSLSVRGLANAVIAGGSVSAGAGIQQITDSRLEVTGGEIAQVNGVTYLVNGQNFQGGYNGGAAGLFQTYSDEIRTFQISTSPTLSISNYQALRDPVNFRRRDGNMGEVVLPNGQPGLQYYGGVFTPGANSVNGYPAPILISSPTDVQVQGNYQQYFDQYTAANVALYDQATNNNIQLTFGGITQYTITNGVVSLPAGGFAQSLPWTNIVSAVAIGTNGTGQEYYLPSIPGATQSDVGFYGAAAAFFSVPGVPTLANGSINVDAITAPTLIGYIYGGIYSKSAQPGPRGTGASNQVFAVMLIPTQAPQIVDVTGFGPGGGPQVSLQFGDGTSVNFNAFPTSFTGGTRVAQGDVTGDGYPDVVVGAGPGGGPQVNVYDGKALHAGQSAASSLILAFYAFPASFSGGVRVAVGELTGDRFGDVVVGAGAGGGPQVNVYDGASLHSGNAKLIVAFYAFSPTFTGGVTVAVADVNGDGFADLIVGAGAGALPQVNVYDGKALGSGQVVLLKAFYAFPTDFRGGVTVAAGDLYGNGKTEIVVGAGAGGSPEVAIFSADGTLLTAYYAYNVGFRGGVEVSVGAYSVSGTIHRAIFTGAGPGAGPQENIFDSQTLQLLSAFYATDPNFRGGVFPAASGLA